MGFSPSKVESILHAFKYAVSTALEYLRHSILTDSIPLDEHDPDDAEVRLVSTWIQYAQAEESLQALAQLCQRVSI